MIVIRHKERQVKVANRVRVIYLLCLLVALSLVFLAVANAGTFIWVALVAVPLLILTPVVATGGIICPKCGAGIYTPEAGVNDANPYYKVVLLGKCCHCGESI